MPFHVTDYLADAGHLTTLEHGAYFLLICNYWQRGEPLPADPKRLRGIVRLTPDEWEEVGPVVTSFFEERDGLLHHKRIDAELQKARDRSSAARENAELSHIARRANRDRTLNGSRANAKPAHSGRNSDGNSGRKADAIAGAEPMPSESLANQDQDKEQVESVANATASSRVGARAAAASLSFDEMVEDLAEATGWRIAGSSIVEVWVNDKGWDFEKRILPLAKQAAIERRQQGRPPPDSWTWLTPRLADPTAAGPPPAARTVAGRVLYEGTPEFDRVVAARKSLRNAVKPYDGRQGVWVPESLLAEVEAQSRKSA
jgi:uncharacterized protein YdaU (DUF1376 family)